MKYTLLIFIAFAFFSCKNQPKENEPAADVTKLVKVEINVNGMTCTGCENTINAKVASLEGVKTVSSSHTDAKTLVSYDSTQTNIGSILSAINETGYQAGKYTFENGNATE